MDTISLGSAWEAVARIRVRSEAIVLVAANGLLGWMERARSRRVLATLDERILRDIGLSRAEIEVESRKPFWRV